MDTGRVGGSGISRGGGISCRGDSPEEMADMRRGGGALVGGGVDASRLKVEDEERESGSGGCAAKSSSDDDADGETLRKRKRYHRHTPRQIREMEQVFQECPHPDEKQRQQLSKSLGLEPRQVKFWFQNRRTQMKAQAERSENSMLRADNERLQRENMTLREAVKNSTCAHCGASSLSSFHSPSDPSGADVNPLRLENSRLKAELDRASTKLAQQQAQSPMGRLGHMGPSLLGELGPRAGGGLGGAPALRGPGPDLALGSLDRPEGRCDANGMGSLEVPGQLSLLAGNSSMAGSGGLQLARLTESERDLVYNLSLSAMEEIIQMARMEEPLWLRSEPNPNRDMLNQDEYTRRFPNKLGPTPAGMLREATRASGLVMMHASALVEMLMDAERWKEMFPCLIVRAVPAEVVSTGVGGVNNRSGSLQLMFAETQVLSPLVPTREAYFLRYCKLLPDSSWAVADVSVDSLRPHTAVQPTCRRRPSGFLIQDMQNGCSSVTIVEHVEVSDDGLHRLYRRLVRTGIAFGAERWLATLQRQCARVNSLVSTITPRDIGIGSEHGRRAMLQLAQRMSTNFCMGVSASTLHSWTTLPGSSVEDVRVMTRKSTSEVGEPQGVVLSAATSLWLPCSAGRVFEFLRNCNRRAEWDILANGGEVEQVANIANGQEGNAVSLIKVQGQTTGGGSNNMLILQESSSDVSGSMVVYAPVDIPAMQVVMSGGNPDYVALLPSGFSIIPDPEFNADGVSGRGSLVTVAFQILVSNLPQAKLSLESVSTVNSLVSCTVQRIRAALV
eukprot:TRINITY_DN17888_c0_g1_i1.p1 TRINITY_DN17888_c0_g1~~TRINITY_DN17888_c0_g1_i1.p1  ORF type:complete len:787 (-),score=147.60 TRINITY_DN17888_c0_g1_i1:997-3357(-)